MTTRVLHTRPHLLAVTFALLAMVVALFATQPARAGAGWGDSTNAAADPSLSTTLTSGAVKVRTYYANSPMGLQADALTGAATRFTGNPLRKFVDPLPGLVMPGGNGITLAIPDTTSYPGSDYYEIAVVEYTQRMHSDLVKATTLRGYVQIDPVATDALAGITGNGGVSPAGSLAIPLVNLDGTNVMISRPSTRPTAVNGFEQVQAVAVDVPHYLGPTIQAAHGTPTRIKFYNGLKPGVGYTDASNVFHREGDLFIPTDHSLFGGGDGQDQLAQGRDILCGDVLIGPNNLPDALALAASACLGGPNNDGAPPTPAGYVHVAAFTQYTENREVLHLHGGDNPWISDGHPHQWITPAADELNTAVGPNYRRGQSQVNVPDMPDPGPGCATYFWPNGQSGRLLFYHDHASGLTRLNVYVGTAAGYLLTDPQERGLLSLVAGEIPLVIQEKTFVPADIATEDAKWDSVHWGQEGDLWIPHVYETNQDPMSLDGTNPAGRWDGASFFWPVFPQVYATPSGEYRDANGYPQASTTPEAFMDTPVINGMAYPALNVDPKAYRFRILSVPNDRMTNLSLFVADPAGGGAPGSNGLTEVKMAPFTSPNGPTATTYVCPDGASAGQTVGTINDKGTIMKAGWTESGPSLSGTTYYPTSFPCTGGLLGSGWGQADNRPGGVPDPSLMGPDIIRIGNEGGLFQQAVVIPPTPINYEYNKRSVTVLNVLERGLWLGPAERADVIIDFSAYAGRTLILYNDSGAPVPAGDPRTDYYTGDGDQTGAGGAPNTVAGYGPNTRTLLQINVSTAAADPPFDVNALNVQLMAAYIATQPKPVVPTPDYKPMADALTAAGQPSFSATAPYEHIFTGAIYLNSYKALVIPVAADVFNYTPAPVCSTTAKCLTTLAGIRAGANGGLVQSVVGQPVNAYVESKAIQELFENDYGRMNATLGVELPFTSVTIQTTIPLAYVDPATETIANGETQFWKITHNGVDSHPVHFHYLNVQVINRVGWDGTVKKIPADEVGWKETVKMHPLEDIIVAVRAKAPPPTPFGMPHSWRQPAPNQLTSDTHGFTQIDPVTGNAPTTPYTNDFADYGSEYVWHCHILGHEENDFMRPFILKAGEVLAPPFAMTGATAGAGGTTVNWTDPTPVPSPLTYYDVISNPSGFLANPNNEIGFRVERAKADVAGTLTGAWIAATPGLHVINAITSPINTLANATTYADTFVPTSPVLATPAAPALVAQTATSVTVTLPALPAGAGGYDVYRDGVLLSAAQLPGNFIDGTALPGNLYQYTLMAMSDGSPVAKTAYRVVAVTAKGETPSSNMEFVPIAAANSLQSAATSVTMIPAAMAGVTVTNPTVGSLQVNWPASTSVGVTGYLVTNGASGGAGNATLAASPDVVTGLAANTSYSFTVAAVNVTGTGQASAVATGLTLPAAPSAPVASAVTATSLSLAWTAPASAAGLTYTVVGAPGSATVTYSGTTAAVSGLTPSTGYSFTVVANNASGASAPSAATGVTTLPAAMAGVTVTNPTVGSLQVNWPASTSVGVTGYLVTNGASGGAGNATLAASPDVVTGLAANTSYSFTVAAVNVTGTGQASAVATGLTLPAAPSAPVASAVTATSLSLAWTAPASAAGLTYTVVGAPGSATVTYSGTTAAVSGLTPSTGYSFTVVANNASGASAPSAATGVTTLPVNAPPGIPTCCTVTLPTATSLTLNWIAPAVTANPAAGAATSYTVQMARNAGFTVGLQTTTGGTATSQPFTGLTANRTYYFRVLAVNATGSSAYSPVFSFTTAALPPRPAAPTVSLGALSSLAPQTVTLTLPALPSGTAGFTVYQQSRVGGGAAWSAATAVATGVTSATFVPTGLVAGTTYRYYLVVVDTAGSSPNGPNSAAVTPRELANAATLNGATPVAGARVGRGTRTVTLGWALGAANSATVTRQQVLTNTTGAVGANGALTGATTTNVAAGATTANVTRLARNTTFYFQIVEVTAGGNAVSNVMSATTAP